MALSKQPRNITVIGGRGNVGAAILAGLLAEGIHKVSVITRSEAAGPDGAAPSFPAGVAAVHRGAYADAAFLASALRGQDVLVVTLAFGAYEAQTAILDAAADAGVPWVVPCEFGSDATHAALNAEVSLMTAKIRYRAQVEARGVSAWIGVVTNPWFDFCMRSGMLGVNFRDRTAELLDGGEVRANFTTLRRVGVSLAALLSLPDADLAEHRNGWVYFSSFLVSQREILASAVRVTGTREDDWTIKQGSTLGVRTWAKEEAAKGNPMGGAMALFALMFSEGFGGNYDHKLIDYKKLGLEKEENLDDVMRELAAELGAKEA